MSNVYERIEARLREEMCPRCVRFTRERTCSLPPDRACALFSNLDKVIDVVRTTRSRRIDPYVDVLRQAVCGSCRSQDESGRCACRDGIDCALDCYFPMIVDSIEQELAKG
jgi:hypothetical protein